MGGRHVGVGRSKGEEFVWDDPIEVSMIRFLPMFISGEKPK
jgi:hypothetical protein